MTVGDIVAACEYRGCDIVDQLGDSIVVTDKNYKEIYNESVESLFAKNGKVIIRTFDKLDKLDKLYKL